MRSLAFLDAALRSQGPTQPDPYSGRIFTRRSRTSHSHGVRQITRGALSGVRQLVALAGRGA
jgi:hypothetical protein